MRIKNANIYREDGIFQKGDLAVEGEYILSSAGGEEINADGLYAIPGLIDIHLHGCVGYDFCDGTREAFDAMALFEAQQGVTAMTPASMTLPPEQLEEIFSNFAAYPNENGAMMCGIYMEGPFFSAEKKGAQNPAYLRLPDRRLFETLQKVSGGKIKVSCIAPELRGALEYIQAVSQVSKVSLAHTAADYDTANRAFLCGASHVTHLFNAMPPFLHRSPGVVGAAFDNGATVELIADGIHLHPSVVRAAFRLFGKDLFVLVSDSMRAAGLPAGTYTLGGQYVTVTANHATLKNGTIAGSVTPLLDCMKKAVSFGIPLETALQAVTVNPAKVIGEYHRMGSLSEGKLANIVLLNSSLEVQRVYVKGRQII